MVLVECDPDKKQFLLHLDEKLKSSLFSAEVLEQLQETIDDLMDKSVCLCVCPTRIELKLNNIQEYEPMKRDLEQKGKQADDNNTEMQQGSTTGGGAEANIAGGAKSRTETIHRRICYDPAPKMS